MQREGASTSASDAMLSYRARKSIDVRASTAGAFGRRGASSSSTSGSLNSPNCKARREGLWFEYRPEPTMYPTRESEALRQLNDASSNRPWLERMPPVATALATLALEKRGDIKLLRTHSERQEALEQRRAEVYALNVLMTESRRRQRERVMAEVIKSLGRSGQLERALPSPLARENNQNTVNESSDNMLLSVSSMPVTPLRSEPSSPPAVNSASKAVETPLRMSSGQPGSASNSSARRVTTLGAVGGGALASPTATPASGSRRCRAFLGSPDMFLRGSPGSSPGSSTLGSPSGTYRARTAAPRSQKHSRGFSSISDGSSSDTNIGPRGSMVASSSPTRVGTALRRQMAATFPASGGNGIGNVPEFPNIGPSQQLIQSPPRVRRRHMP